MNRYAKQAAFPMLVYDEILDLYLSKAQWYLRESAAWL